VPTGPPVPSRSTRRRILTLALWTAVALGAGYALWLAWRDATVADIPHDLQPLPLVASLTLRIAATLLTVVVWLGLYRGLGGTVGALDGFRIYLLTKYTCSPTWASTCRAKSSTRPGASPFCGIAASLPRLA
jgi:hypothetical protein